MGGNECIVFNLHVPIEGGQADIVQHQSAQHHGAQVEKMGALVDKLTASRKLGIRSPFLFISFTPAVTVSRPDKLNFAESTRGEMLPKPSYGGVKAMVVSHAKHHFMSLRQVHQALHLFNSC
ncbi:unannotated protein [freshwater metagenome]|uniref:Unannotated protein n=1 Tax=freshwater metagenome TaxID=449393 RepID=A0A6J7GZ83_9ZZZZ